jgi:hydrogenase maturation protease
MARQANPAAVRPLRLMRRAPSATPARAGSQRMLLLCCGNADRGDDGAGPACADALRLLGVHARCVPGDAFTLMDAWAHHAEVTLVDAVVTGAAPAGTLHRYEVRSGAGIESFERSLSGSTHGMGIAEAFRLGRITKNVPEHAVIYAIEAASFEWGAGLSREVHEAVQTLATKLAAEQTQTHSAGQRGETRRASGG